MVGVDEYPRADCVRDDCDLEICHFKRSREMVGFGFRI